MNELLIGYARVSTYEQDLTAQRIALERLGVDPAYIFTDHGLTGTNRARPGLREALAACRNGDTLVVAKLDRLARSLRDAKDIVDELTAKHVKLSIGGSVHDPLDPVGRLLFNVSCDGRRIRVRSDPSSNPRGHAGSKGQGSAPREAAETVHASATSLDGTAQRRYSLDNRARRTVQRCPLHDL
jgi:hypothetical protein